MGRRSIRDVNRLHQGAGAVFSLRRAAELLPIDDVLAREWMRTQNLVRTICGREVVTWRAVLAAIEAGELQASDVGEAKRPDTQESRHELALTSSF